AMPGPVSAIVIAAASPSRATVTVSRPPPSIACTALRTRFASTGRSRSGSACAHAARAGELEEVAHQVVEVGDRPRHLLCQAQRRRVLPEVLEQEPGEELHG